MTVSQEQFLEAIRTATAVSGTEDDPGVTAEEISTTLGVSLPTVYIRLRRLFRAGRVVVGRRHQPRISGGTYPVPVYRLKDAE